MKNLSFLLILSGFSFLLQAQQDPKAKKILDRVSAKTKQYTSIQVDFELIIDNKRDDMSSNSKGILILKGDKYFMESAGTKVYYNGEFMWTFMEDINEVTISEPDKNSEDFVENPTILFDFYNKDFKYKLVGETKMDEGWMYEIDLFPNNLEQPYSRFKIFISREREDIHLVQAVGKDGVDYTTVIRNAKYNEEISDDQFTFDPSKYKDIELIDLRF